MISRRRFGALVGAIPVLAAVAPVLARAAEGKAHVVDIRKFIFEPADLTIGKGDTVKWVNRDIVPHTATELKSAAWDTGKLARNQEGAVVFDQAGTHTYKCAFHPHMKGRVHVRDS